MTETLVQFLLAAGNGDNGINFIYKTDIEQFISYTELYNNALIILNNLRERGIKSNDQLVFQVNDIKSYVYTYWACILGRIVPVTLAVGNDNEKYLKVCKVWEALNNPHFIYDDPSILTKLETFSESAGYTKTYATITNNKIRYQDIEKGAKKAEPAAVKPDDIAYIQFSSGSTGNPKGVVLTHRNIITNIKDIISYLEATSDDTFFTWKPLTHDFSLIAFHLAPLVAKASQCLVPTNSFIWRPSIWFEKVNAHRASILGSPNFGYRHFLKLYKKGKRSFSWDLSCVKYIINGAEPISVKLCEDFLAEMKQYGLKRTAMFPAYGLAEASLIVSFSPINTEYKVHTVHRNSLSTGSKIERINDRDVQNAVQFVDVGYSMEHLDIRITDDRDAVLPEETVGNILIKGGNVTSGYYNNRTATEAAFTSDGWLKTGDLGFISDKRLVITGRAKEVIFVNGINYYPHDLEQLLIEELDKNDLNKYIICGVYNEEIERDELLIFVYYKKNITQFPPISHTLRRIIQDKAGLTVDRVIPIKRIPKTTSGKIRRIKLGEDYKKGVFDEVLAELSQLSQTHSQIVSTGTVRETSMVPEIITQLKDDVSRLINLEISDISLSFLNLGLNSINIPQLQETINNRYKVQLTVDSIFNYPSIELLAQHINAQLAGDTRGVDTPQQETKEDDDDAVAIIGLAGKFPGGAESYDQFIALLADEVDAVIEVPADRWDKNKYYDSNPNAPGKSLTMMGGFITGPVDEFDAGFFGISPREARGLDPQQRILLEATWQAFEDAAIDISQLKGSNTGVYIGMSNDDYAIAHRHARDLDDIDAYSLTGTAFSTACGRISYTFGFEGPCLAIDTACSSGLSALHTACRGIQNGETDIAVVGAANILLYPNYHVCFSKLQAISPDGKCKTFDKDANGYARGEGCGVVILKKLKAAIRDDDRIYAVVKGTAINQDGKSNGLTAPNGQAQQKCMHRALQTAALQPADIDYVETHGTGTPLGDPIEVNAVGAVYGTGRPQDNPLYIGSVKTNIGHLEPVAGLASLFKVIGAMQRETLFPNLHFNTPNPYIAWDKYPIQVVSQALPWDKDNRRIRRAGINSFGFGGSNAHVIVEEAPQNTRETKTANRDYHLSALSAKDEASLKQLCEKYHTFLTANPGLAIGDVCYTMVMGRCRFDHRLAIPVKTPAELIERLYDFIQTGTATNCYSNITDAASQPEQNVVNDPIHALCLHYVNDEKFDYHAFKERYTGNKIALPTYPFQRLPYTAVKKERALEQKFPGTYHPVIGQKITSLFLKDITMYQSQFSADEPSFIKEHIIYNTMISPGAAHISMMLSAGKELYTGTHYFNLHNIDFINPLLIENGRERVVQIGIEPQGDVHSVSLVSADADNPDTTRLKHCTALVKPVSQKKPETFKKESNASFAKKIDHDTFYTMMENVEFELGRGFKVIEHIEKNENDGICVIRLPDNVAGNDNYEIYPGMLDGVLQFAFSVSRIDYDQLAAEKAVFIPLSIGSLHYYRPFPQTVTCYATTELQDTMFKGHISVYDEAGDLLMEINDFIAKKTNKNILLKELSTAATPDVYSESWMEQALPVSGTRKATPDCYYIFNDSTLGSHLASCVEKGPGPDGQKTPALYLIEKGAAYEADGHTITINPDDRSQLERVLNTHTGNSTVLYLWGLEATHPDTLSSDVLQKEQEDSCHDLLQLVRTLAERETGTKETVKLWIITRNSIHTDRPDVALSQAALRGISRVIALEYPELWGGIIDIDEKNRETADLIVAEVTAANGEEICIRNKRRFVRRLVRNQLPASYEPIPVKTNASYLITGGLGALGLLCAQRLAAEGASHIVLTGRNTPGTHALEVIEDLKQRGVTVTVMPADISLDTDVNRLMQSIMQSMPPLRGVIHAAGVLDDAPISKQTRQSLQKVLAPKVAGSWNLHTALQNMTIDFFIMFSSLTAIIGNPGQSNYAAANAFLDALALYRHNNNLPATTINWGPWTETGMARANTRITEGLHKRGLIAISPEAGLDMMMGLPNTPIMQPVIGMFDWPVYSKHIPDGQRKGLYSPLSPEFAQQESAAPQNRDTITDRVIQATPVQRKPLVLRTLQQLTADIMGYKDLERIARDKPLMDQGVDSIMALDLRNVLSKTFDYPIPTTLMFNYPTLYEITDYLLETVFDFPSSGKQDDETTQDEQTEVDILDEITELLN